MQAEGFRWIRHYAHLPLFLLPSHSAGTHDIFSLAPLRGSFFTAEHSDRFVQENYMHKEMAEMGAAHS